MTSKGNAKHRGGSLEPPEQSRIQRRTKTRDEELDEALQLTFPASDPVALVQPTTHVGSHADSNS